MGEATSQIEQHIQETRGELGGNINELQQKVKDAVNWRLYVQRRPWQMLALAFGAGMLTSFVTSISRSQRTGALNGKSSQMWNNIKAAASTAVIESAKEFAKEILPDFRAEYRMKESAIRSSMPTQEPGCQRFHSEGI